MVNLNKGVDLFKYKISKVNLKKGIDLFKYGK